MIKFKSFLKIFKSQIPSMAIYLAIFAVIVGINIGVGGNDKNKGYENYNITVAVIDKDGSELSHALKDYIGKNMEIKDIIQTEDGMEDALFQRIVEYIVIIPENYQQDLLAGKDTKIESKQVADAYSAVYSKNLIQQYIGTFKSYCSVVKSNGETVDYTKVIDKTNKIVSQGTKVEVIGKESGKNNIIEQFFNFGAYIILACVMWGISEIFALFFDEKISRRMEIAPVSQVRISMQIMLYALMFTLATYLIQSSVYMVMLNKRLFNYQGAFSFANLFIISLVASAIGFCISVVCKSKNARGAVTNTLALGLSFISGVFVPLDYLSKSVKQVAEFTPAYWFVKANEYITKFNSGNSEVINKIVYCFGIEILFVIAFASVGTVIKKHVNSR